MLFSFDIYLRINAFNLYAYNLLYVGVSAHKTYL